MALDSERFTTAGSKLLGIRDSAGRLLSTAADRCHTSAKAVSDRLGLNEISAPEPVARVAAKFGKKGLWREAIVARFNRNPIVKFISASLLWRILASNLIGFLILFLGILVSELGFELDYQCQTRGIANPGADYGGGHCRQRHGQEGTDSG